MFGLFKGFEDWSKDKYPKVTWETSLFGPDYFWKKESTDSKWEAIPGEEYWSTYEMLYTDYLNRDEEK